MMKIARFLFFGGSAFFLLSILLVGGGCFGAFGEALQGESGTANTGETIFNLGIIIMFFSILAAVVGIIVALLGKAVGARD